MGFAREVADTVHFMNGGQVFESGALAQLFEAAASPRLQGFLSQVL
jgi:polar amino acid transport system ATP-binding protein